MAARAALEVIPLGGMPLFAPGMSVAAELASAIDRAGVGLREGDILVVAQKIVSKAEWRTVDLASVMASEEARFIAETTGRAVESVQLVLDESASLLRTTPAAIIARHRTGHVLANAGIDSSNVPGGDDGAVLLWPVDPDASARSLRAELVHMTGVRPAVVIADSMGRAWRIGTLGQAIGVAGLAVLEDRRGTGSDLYGRTLQATVIGVADAVAAMAVLAMGEGAEGTPAALVRGAARWVEQDDGPGATSGLRSAEQDMFL